MTNDTTLRKTARLVLSSTPRQGNATVQAVAKKAGVEVQTARRHLDNLVAKGQVHLTGAKETGKRGRPAHLYRRLTEAELAAAAEAQVESTEQAEDVETTSVENEQDSSDSADTVAS